MTVTIRPAAVEDTAAITELIAELNAFYGDAPQDSSAVQSQQVRLALFGESPAASVLLAISDGRPVALASYSILWPAVGFTTSLYLKELYVAEAYRRQGIGKALMTALRKEALQRGCSRVEWTADEDNPGAIRFYETIGTKSRTAKIFYRENLAHQTDQAG
ncbi:GNAT family N-acetyltransferase [Actinomadura xylanilytica]|uniref:GNAT family N-acetyltransferase n=1 Tax=Actinomadura xylanilytica TaxID=887459 RepID=UPI00255ACB10|nr:GNAT family N-acetyltransferase [Actinomadura xylanilytica]MDL4775750.1 GNAT family N-acetyltransferase [Actinomadura xylanilytica]